MWSPRHECCSCGIVDNANDVINGTLHHDCVHYCEYCSDVTRYCNVLLIKSLNRGEQVVSARADMKARHVATTADESLFLCARTSNIIGKLAYGLSSSKFANQSALDSMVAILNSATDIAALRQFG